MKTKTFSKRLRLAHLSVMIALTLNLCTNARAAQPDSDALLIKKLSNLEYRYFDRDYRMDGDVARVVRLERFVYGEAGSGPIEERIQNLNSIANEHKSKKSVAKPVAAEQTVQAEPTAKAKPIVRPEPTAKTEPIVQPEPTAKTEPIVQPEPTAKTEPIVQPEPNAQAAQTVTQAPQVPVTAHVDYNDLSSTSGQAIVASALPTAAVNPLVSGTTNEPTESIPGGQLLIDALAKKTIAKKKSRKQPREDIAISGQSDYTEDLVPAKIESPLQGEATFYDLNQQLSDSIQRFTKLALDRKPEYAKSAKAVDHFRTKTQRAIRFTKDAINYAYPYRGFSMSMEGSRVLLDKNQKLSNLWISELVKQRHWDEMHPQIMSQLMEIAMGLGMENSELSNTTIQKGYSGLADLVGEETAKKTVAEMTEWKSHLQVPEELFHQLPWDAEQSEKVYHNTLETSASGDPLIRYVYDRIKKFDHGKLANYAASMVEANLSAMTVLSGNPFASAAAEGVNTAFVMSTGGPEENKILHELYYGRRLEIRRKRLSDEAQLALSNYEKALLTHNSPQLAMSEIMFAGLVGPEKISLLLDRDPITEFTTSAPIELAQTGSK